MHADPIPEHDPAHHDADTAGSVPVERMPLPRPASDNNPEYLPEILPDTIPENNTANNADDDADDDDVAEWWYDNRGKRGKHYHYTGRVKRIGGSAGEKIRAELAAAIYDLLMWAKQQQMESEKESREDGRADDQPE